MNNHRSFPGTIRHLIPYWLDYGPTAPQRALYLANPIREGRGVWVGLDLSVQISHRGRTDHWVGLFVLLWGLRRTFLGWVWITESFLSLWILVWWILTGAGGKSMICDVQKKSTEETLSYCLSLQLSIFSDVKSRKSQKQKKIISRCL